MRWSATYIPTLRGTPADAEVVSHRLMLKAGMIRKVAAGIYTHLPLGLRAFRRLEHIVREEMDRAGALEVCLPAVQPAELWQESGRWETYGPELLRLRDRHGRDFCLGPSHEEIMLDLVRHELRSYRDLPLTLYQIQTRFRDEVRPRLGLMRGREFARKEALSFDRDRHGLDRSFAAMETAYQRVFRRCGLRFKTVQAHCGATGGYVSHEFHVPAGSGEDQVVSCTACEHAASIETAAVLPPPAVPVPAGLPAAEEIATPGKHTVEEVATFLGIQAAGLIKTLLIEVGAGEGVPGEPLAVLVRGDHELSEAKLTGVLDGRPWRFAEEHQIQQWTGGPMGFSGPVGLGGIRILADHAILSVPAAVVGANRPDAHLRNAVRGRDYEVEGLFDLRAAREGDACPGCGAPRTVVRGIEVGHVLKLGSRYSAPMKATFLDPEGQERPYEMGGYGLGIGRTVAAAIEQSHDGDGIVWPLAIAPFEVLITVVNAGDGPLVEAAAALHDGLEGAGIPVLLDDRDERAGVKFKDGDLIGIPLRAVYGSRNFESGQVELSLRRDREKRLVPAGEARQALLALREELVEAV